MKKHIKLTAILTIAAIVLTFVNVPTAKAQQTAINCGLFSSIKEDFSGKEMSQKKYKKKQYYEVTLTKLNQGYKNYVEGLTMTVWGKCAGNADYKVGHKDVTMPSIDAKYEKLVLKLF